MTTPVDMQLQMQSLARQRGNHQARQPPVRSLASAVCDCQQDQASQVQMTQNLVGVKSGNHWETLREADSRWAL